jgi:hypothetical protein
MVLQAVQALRQSIAKQRWTKLALLEESGLTDQVAALGPGYLELSAQNVKLAAIDGLSANTTHRAKQAV